MFRKNIHRYPKQAGESGQGVVHGQALVSANTASPAWLTQNTGYLQYSKKRLARVPVMHTNNLCNASTAVCV